MPANTPLITTRFDATSTSEDVVRDVDLSGVRAIVTGASSGIGLETARALACAGAASPSRSATQTPVRRWRRI